MMSGALGEIDGRLLTIDTSMSPPSTEWKEEDLTWYPRSFVPMSEISVARI
jgi:hypothetical protein